MTKIRLDILLVERGLAESRNLAQRLVMAGQVRVDGQIAFKPSQEVTPKARIEINTGPRYVSRGGEKLAAALQAFQIDVNGRVCADVGASTGGFSDCLLQNGATRVYAIDVGKGQLHWKLRQDARVVVMEKINARYLEQLPEKVDLVTIDASFISLRLLLPVVKGWLASAGEARGGSGQVIALIKPQFEAGREMARRSTGVIREPQDHRQILQDVLEFSSSIGFEIKGLVRSPIRGPKGNIEFLAWMSVGQAEDRHSIVELLSRLFDVPS